MIMRHIRTYEELDFKKLNPFRIFKGSIEGIFESLNLSLVGYKETSFRGGGSINEYKNYTLKIKSTNSLLVDTFKLNLEGAYLTVRISKETEEYRVIIYYKFEDEILEKLGIVHKHLLRGSKIGFTGPGDSPYYLNSIDRKNTLIKVKSEEGTKADKLKGLENLKKTLSDIVSNIGSYNTIVTNELSRIRLISIDDNARKKAQEEERQKQIEKKRKLEEERQRIIELKKKHYRDIDEDIDDYLLEISDISTDKAKTINDYSIIYRFNIGKKNGNNMMFILDDKYEDVMRGLLQAKRRVKDKYPDVTMEIGFNNGDITIQVYDNNFNEKNKSTNHNYRVYPNNVGGYIEWNDD